MLKILIRSLLLCLLISPYLQSCLFSDEIAIGTTSHGIAVINKSGKEVDFYFQTSRHNEVIIESLSPFLTQEIPSSSSVSSHLRDGDEGPLDNLEDIRNQFLVFRLEVILDGEIRTIKVDFENDLQKPDESDYTRDNLLSHWEKSYKYNLVITDEMIIRQD